MEKLCSVLRKKDLSVYKGDTYIGDCKTSLNCGPSSAKCCLFFAILASAADLFILNRLVAMSFGISQASLQSVLIASALAAGLFAGANGLGSLCEEMRVFGKKGNLIPAIIWGAFIAAVIAVVTWFRFCAESAEATNEALTQSANAATQSSLAQSVSQVVQTDPVAVTGLLTLLMLASAITSFFYAFLSKDAVRERIYQQAKGNFATDKELYTKTWNDEYTSAQEELVYETDERNLDIKLKEAQAEVFKLTVALSSVVDPADVDEIIKWSTSSALQIKQEKETKHEAA